MTDIRTSLKYTREHEWIHVDGRSGTIGITDYAQKALGDITFVELPEVGTSFKQGETFGVIESVKAASDLYMPVEGEISEVNHTLEAKPEVVNEDPYGSGAWLVKIKIDNPEEIHTLLSKEKYEKILEAEKSK